jgi:amino acid adenylation domain-containing protein
MSGQYSLFSLLGEVAKHSPESLAIAGLDRNPLNYGSLIRQIEDTAEYLRRSGIARDDRVATVIGNGPEAAVCWLAVSASAICAPLNPALSQSEFEFYLRDLGPKALIVDSRVSSSAAAAARAIGLPVAQLMVADNEPAGTFGLHGGLKAASLSSRRFSEPDDVAILLYTSGSTSRPKLVPITHASLCRTAQINAGALALKDNDCGLNVMPLFHLHGLVFAVLSSLSVGSRVICTPGFDPSLFFEWLVTFRPTWYTAAPTIHRAVVGRAAGNQQAIANSCLRFIRSGASGLSETLMRELEQVFGIPVIEAYAMTEAGLISINKLPPERRKANSAGLPIGCDLAVMDEDRRPTPAGAIGNLAIRGENVTRGYERNPEANERSFHDGWFYTGDQGKLDSDGYLFLTGRTSEIINRGGEKISPREIDEVLMQHPAVLEAVSFPIPHPSLGEQVAASVILRPHADAMDLEVMEIELQKFVAQRLAMFKVPHRIAFVADIPKGPTGKPLRTGLVGSLGLVNPPSRLSTSDASLTALRNSTEQRLVAMWRTVLGNETIGIHDDFFELGGDSIVAAHVVARVGKEFGVTLPMFLLFRTPTIAGLAEWLDSGATLDALNFIPFERPPRPRQLPLSHAQQRLWFLAQMEGISHAYHISRTWCVRGQLERQALREALNRIVARHEVLRTSFVTIESEPVQRIMPEAESFDLSEEDLSGHADARAELARVIAEAGRAPFDLEAGQLIRGRLIRLEEEEHVLLITMHHIISDGWSLGVFMKELGLLYGAIVRGDERGPLPELEVQYADYAVWQRTWIEEDKLLRQKEYWKKTLAGAPSLLKLPTDHRRPAKQDYAGAKLKFIVPEDLSEGLKGLSKKHGNTLYMTLLAAWIALLARLSRQQDVVVGTPVANRRWVEIENLIGFFVNTLALRLDLSDSPTVATLLSRMKEQVLLAQQHQDLPFEQVVDMIGPVRNLAHNPLFQVMFDWQDTEALPMLTGLELKALDLEPPEIAKFDLTLSLREKGKRIEGALEYATALFERATMERHLGYVRVLLEAMVADDSQRVDCISLLTENERHHVLVEWNATRAEYPPDEFIHELFEEQVRNTPEAVAVVFQDTALTYRELNGRANQLAHYLRFLGVKPGERAGICMQRGLEMVVGLLAVLKAGGAYVPLEHGYPDARLRYVVDDSRPGVLLVQRQLRGWITGIRGGTQVVDVDERSLWAEESESNIKCEDIGLTSSRLAYVIYTSGSTGSPKGVIIEHRAVCNQIRALQAQWQHSAQDRLLQFASIAFDASVEEIFGALLSGATLVVRDDTWLADARKFWSLAEKQGITVVDLPTRFWRQILEDRAVRIPPNVRAVIIGGEAVEPQALANWFTRDSHRPALWNSYGPTETTVNATLHQMLPNPSTWDSVGRPIANTRVYILDAQKAPVPIGVAGELYICGAGVAQGYLNRAKLTAERFGPDPYTSEPGTRAYKTGDMGRWLADGTIEFLGRNDDQVKIHGYRIELGEIEARVAEHAGVKEAVVMARQDTVGEKQLAVYYTVADCAGAGEITAEQLRTHVASFLPAYMVPAAYLRLEFLPLTPNGKVDHRALPAPTVENYAVAGYEATAGEVETTLARIWVEVLKVGRVGRHDNFFALGGHSLLAGRVMTRISQLFEVEMTLNDLFARPTLFSLAEQIVELQLQQFNLADLQQALTQMQSR